LKLLEDDFVGNYVESICNIYPLGDVSLVEKPPICNYVYNYILIKKT
jgi:hypothetical protein